MTTRPHTSWLQAIAAAVCATGALMLASPAHAVSVVWELADVTFADFTLASGSFAYDADTNTYSDWNLSVQQGGAFSVFTYAPGVDGGFVGIHDATQVDFVAFPPATSGRYLRLAFSQALTNSGGFVLLRVAGEGFECDNCSISRQIVAGAVVSAVPEPSAWALMALGLAVSGAVARRRRTADQRVGCQSPWSFPGACWVVE